ncbi:MAG: galactose oxidase early set domain-containing protein [Armatimonadota bacterium]|nr:galactose oxidase early set domain-containing protein [Armatimonadota bacterium]
MNTRKLTLSVMAAVCANVAVAQHTTPNTWTALIGPAQGWPNERSGRAIHMVHVPPVNPAMGNRGTILFWGRSNDPGDPVRPKTWVPPTYLESAYGTFGVTNNQLDYEAFCCGQTLMADGKVVITGSNFKPGEYPLYPGKEVATYSLATNTWTKSGLAYELNRKRYYPSTIRMPDGKILTLGGQATQQPPGSPIQVEFVDRPFEINPNTVSVSATNWQMPVEEDWDFLNYPFAFPVSATEVFFAGPSRNNGQGGEENYRTFYFDTGASDIGPVNFGGFSETWHGSVAMYRPGLILKTGGVSHITGGYANVPATNQAEAIDVSSLSSSDVGWTFVTPMNHARIDHNTVILADGRVMVVGGTLYHNEVARTNEANWVQSGEIWNPTTNIWTMTANFNTSGGGQVPDPKVFRGYHSAAVLMPDARVLLAGGDVGFNFPPGVGNETQVPSGHFYLPDYGTGTRPKITAGPDIVRVGSSGNSITVDDSGVTKVALVGLGAVTHSYDMNQRYMTFNTSGAGTTKTFNGPVSSTQAPYGWYMLFALKPGPNGSMLPCEMAKYVQVLPPEGN